MMVWIKRLGLSLVFISGAMIILSYAQWYICRSKPAALDQAGVGIKNCFYYESSVDMILLLIGCILTIGAFVFEKMTCKKIL